MTGILMDLGRKEYGSVLELQRNLAERRARREVPNIFILVEHDHVITLGRKTTPENFKPQDVPVFKVERGGDATYHGPGQLVGYPILLLEDHDVRRHVRTLEAALIKTVGRFGVDGELVNGHPGVWVKGKKLASIGVAVTNWVTYHGFALNVNTDMAYFDLIRPCGLDPGSMTSMKQLAGREMPFEDVKLSLVEDISYALRENFTRETPIHLAAPTNIK